METKNNSGIKPSLPDVANGQSNFNNVSQLSGVISTIQTSNNGTCPTSNARLSIDDLSVAQMESLLSPCSRRRSENFAQGEIHALIEEIGKHRHVLLSKCRALRLERRYAWDEVAKALNSKHPNLIKRTGPQASQTRENS